MSTNSTDLYNDFQELLDSELMPKLWDNGKKVHKFYTMLP